MLFSKVENLTVKMGFLFGWIHLLFPISAQATSAPSLSFRWVPSTIYSGDLTYRTWSSTNATQCIGDNGSSVGTSGSSAMRPQTQSKSVTMTCTGPGGTVSKTASLTVLPKPPAPTLSFKWVPATIYAGELTHREWTSTDASGCIGDNGSSVGTSGSSVHQPQTESKTVTMTCSGPGGTVSKTASLTVLPKPPAPTLSFKWVPATIYAGELTHREWTSTDASECIGDNGSSVGTSGSSVHQPQTESKTVTMTCTGPGGTVSKTITLMVLPMETAELRSPKANSTISNSGLCFSWEVAAGATHYTVQVSSDAAFNEHSQRWAAQDWRSTQICWSNAFLPNENASHLSELETGKTYYWRIKSMNNPTGQDTSTTFTEAWRFTVGDSSAQPRTIKFIHTDLLGNPAAETSQ